MTPLPSGAAMGCKKGRKPGLAFCVSNGSLEPDLKIEIVPALTSC